MERRGGDVAATGASPPRAGDVGCLLNRGGKRSRGGRRVGTRHVAEVLAGMADGPAIGEPAAGSETR